MIESTVGRVDRPAPCELELSAPGQASAALIAMRSLTLRSWTWIALVLPACGPAPAPSAARKDVATNRVLDGLLGLMRERLEIMHDVARYKWAAGSPIEDPGREQALLADVAERGRGLGLDPATTRAFFTAQIEAAKIVQRDDLRRWQADPRTVPGDAPDLKGVLRPRIDAINRSLLAALARVQVAFRKQRPDPATIRNRADQRLNADGVNADARAAAIGPLLAAAP
jgi:chorismate mutase